MVRQAHRYTGLKWIPGGDMPARPLTQEEVLVVAPRGAEFLLNRNRINVAVSRGQWRAVIVRSPELTHYMPSKSAALLQLGAFIGLSKQGKFRG